MGGRVDDMKKAGLMKYAASLGAPTRKPAAPTQRRAVKDVREDGKLREAAQRQPSPARAGEPGAASSDRAAPSVSHGPASVQAPARAGEPGAANSSLAAPSVSRGPASAGAPGARAGGPGSSSLNQAQVAPSAPATAARKPVAGAADVTSSDAWEMNQKELHALATSLGAGTRENRKSSGALRAARCRALPQAPQRQHSRAGASEPGAASSDLAAPAASREPASGPRTASSSQAPRANRRLAMPKSARAERAGVLGREGSWKRAAEESARLCQQDGPSHLPPCYAGLYQEPQRRLTSQMCGRLENAQWATCVVRWRARYDLPAEYEFSHAQQGLRAQQAPWFDPGASVITRASVEEAQCYLAANYPSGGCESIARRLHDPERRRTITICGGCHMHVGEDNVLPPPAGEMRTRDFVAGPEMVLALAHPLVQVHTTPRTGQLAHVGHICNFRQKVSKFLKSLPVMPADMPVVHVRPRALGFAGAKGKSAGRALFRVDISKLKAAFLWSKANSPYHAKVEWRGDAADAWAGDDVEVGTTREADSDASHAPPVTPTCFARWMEHGRTEAVAGDFGHVIGNRLREVISDGDCDDEGPGPAGAAGSRTWAEVRRLVADVFGKNVFRMATTLPRDIPAVALAARGVLDLGLPRGGGATDTLRALRSLDTDERPVDLHVFRAELDAAMKEEHDEDPQVVHAGTTASAEVGDDVGPRQGVLDSLAHVAQEVIGRPVDEPGSASPRPDEAPEVGAATAGGPSNDAPRQGPADEPTAAPGSASACPDEDPPAHGRPVKYPRVDPPEVEDQPGQAIREDTPGYIAKAFPKLLPYGAGDYRGARPCQRRTLRFEEWGRHVMLWHDGRLMRHTRFRHWLLDTMLRAMVPGAQRTFRARKACEECSVMDKTKRRELVQQMSTVTNLIPGPIGERRKMRQELEAMVHQIEAETADLGMNGGAGRIPSGFRTLTRSVYKWAQLHATLLKACPSSDAAVARHCAVKLEMATALTDALLTDDAPGRADAQQKVEAELAPRTGVDISVDDIPDLSHFGQGGINHAHMAFWVIGAPRIDMVEAPREPAPGSAGVEIEAPLSGQHAVPQAQAADRSASPDLAGEVGVRQGIGPAREKQVRSPESISHEAHARCLLGSLDSGGADSDRCWADLVDVLEGCSRTPREVLEAEFLEPGSASLEARQARARLRFVAALAEWVNMHDLHKPCAVGPPAKDQPRAHVDDERSNMERVSCKKLSPRKTATPGEEEVAEGQGRRDLHRLWLARNCNFLNNFARAVMLATLSNMDFRATLTKDAVIEYMTKYT
ncbi:unnamed protein product [Prorocentrum cordatum]|uniref:DUF6570 domain-containing protein n=1 Tax=Prorocentrum cordatum TaxID=2364126 RepID=A0ABN9V3T8_9DINO|nr:unnamed protein product [Polarella glacialis]